MRPNNQEKPNERVRLQLGNQVNPKQIAPPKFRSWEQQSQKTEPEEELQTPSAPLRQHRNRYSFWHSQDFKVIVALLITAIIAAAVYYTMKG